MVAFLEEAALALGIGGVELENRVSRGGALGERSDPEERTDPEEKEGWLR